MRKLGVAISLSTALLYGCGTSAEPMPSHTQEAPSAPSSAPATPAQPTVPPQPTFEQEKADFINYFNLAKGYWLNKGVNVSGTQLVIVDGDQAVNVCGGTHTGNQPGGGYCYVGNTVFFTRSTLEYIGSDAMLPRTPYEVPRMEAAATHELAHPVQYAVGDTHTVFDYQASPRKFEDQADCYAGRTVEALSPNLGPIVTSIYFQFLPGSDAGQPAIYGTTAERKQEFVKGFGGDPCVAEQ